MNSTKQSNIIIPASPHEAGQAEHLAHELGLLYLPARDQAHADSYCLIQTADYLGASGSASEDAQPFYIDFLSGKLRYRHDHASLKRELLAKALGKKPKDRPSIVDATAGLGRDSFILATLGFEVTLLEQSPLVFALLRDGLQRAAHHTALADTIARMHLINANAYTWLPAQAIKPDIVYLDPMFPEREKSALVKKEMVILQHLLGKCSDNDDLLTMALSCSKQRVVVKRSRLAKTLANKTPSYSLTGNSSRFDIYLVP